MFNKYIQYYEMYNLRPVEYSDSSLDELFLPDYLKEFLEENNINNIQRLISLSRKDLLSRYYMDMSEVALIEQRIKKLARAKNPEAPTRDPEAPNNNPEVSDKLSNKKVDLTVKVIPKKIDDSNVKGCKEEEEDIFIPFYKKYHIDAKRYSDIMVGAEPLSNRAKGRMIWRGITTVEQLLKLCLHDLNNMDHLGPKSVNEIVSYIEGLNETHVEDDANRNDTTITNAIGDNADKKNCFPEEDDYIGQDTRPYKDIFSVKPEDYAKVFIFDTSLSNRIKNRLLGIGIKTVCELLYKSPSNMRELRNLGNKSINEIYYYLQNVSDNVKSDEEKISGSAPIETPQRPVDYDETPFKLLFNLSPEDYKFMNIAEFSFSNRLGNRIARLNISTIADLLEHTYLEFKKLGGFGNNCQNELNAFLLSLQGRGNQVFELSNAYADVDVVYYINAYTEEEYQREELKGNIYYQGMTLKSYVDYYKQEDVVLSENVRYFINWCNFDIESEVTNLIQLINSKDRWYQIVKMRSQKATLDAAGQELGVTRERVRQIENKVKIAFERYCVSHRLLWKIYAIRGGDDILTPVELSEYFGEYSDIVVYLLKQCSIGREYYDKQSDAFVMSGREVSERVQNYVEQLPETFKESAKENIITEGIENYDLPEELLSRAIDEYYNQTGGIYHRSRLTLRKIYSDVLKRYYPRGMHIYDSAELEQFREYVSKDYEIDVSKSDRAIIAALSDVGILCGRGRYKLNEGSLLSDGLKKRIETYVEDSDNAIISIGAIFDEFETALNEEGIDNRYYLQGVMHELFDDKWTFRRDYVSKDPNVTSVYTAIVSYIKNSKYPVTRENIIIQFPGITDIVISLAVSDPSIINLFGEYVHCSNLKFTDRDVKLFRDVLDDALSVKKIVHSKDLFARIMALDSTLLANSFINSAFGVYSVLEYYFHDDYMFSRPFISKDEIQYDSAGAMLHELVGSSDRISIEEVQAFAKEVHHTIFNVLDFINSCNDVSLLINSAEMMRIDEIGITDNVISKIEEILEDEVTGTIPIAHVQGLNNLPPLNVPWTDWLLYSVINKYSNRFEVAQSAEQFRFSFPVVSRKGELSLDAIKTISKEDVGSIAAADDLENIDDLIGDYILGEDDIL